MSRLLVTIERDGASEFKEELKSGGWDVLHLPLEQYSYCEDPVQTETVLDELESYRFVLYGGVRNARYFLHWLGEQQLQEEARQMIHLAMNREEADYLEQRDIPVIVPIEGGKAIDLMEFLLRISVEGAVLYPTVEGRSEEIPGLLEELGMTFTELTVCSSTPFSPDRLGELRREISGSQPDTILFHSRGSIIRTRTAFPDLNLENCRLIAASKGVAWKLQQEGLNPDLVASGSWKSLTDLLQMKEPASKAPDKGH